MAEPRDVAGSHDDGGKLVLRVALGVLILFHGIAKVIGGPAFIIGVASPRQACPAPSAIWSMSARCWRRCC